MIRRPPRSTRTDTLFPYTTLFRSSIANVPDLHDVKTTLRLLAELGAGVIVEAGADLQIDPRTVRSHAAPYELVKTTRASVPVPGPLLATYGAAEVSLPGGCAIGPRPVDTHIKAPQAPGARMPDAHGLIKAQIGSDHVRTPV